MTEQPRLSVQADLTIEVAGETARLTSAGPALTLTAEHPERVWASLLASALPAGVGDLSGPRSVGRIADQLGDAGLSLVVTGPRGTVAHLGDGVDSRAGRAFAGSRRVAPGAPLALAALVPTWVVTGAAAAALAAAAWVIRASSRRTSPTSPRNASAARGRPRAGAGATRRR